jgi:thiol-disulfide isomerase/thioredoxin
MNRLLRVGVELDEYLGKVERTPRAPEWRASMKNYVPDPIVVEGLSEINEKVTVVCFCAHWCKDCLKHVPELAITLRNAKNRKLRLVMLDYDQNKKLAEEVGVEAIPTFITFGAKGSETGRIIEHPSPPHKFVSEELLSRLAPSK